MDTTKDYYAILGVLQTAEGFIIQAAFRALCKRYHPDVYAGKDAGARMAAVNEAYEVLGTPSKRKEYDQRREQSKEDDTEFFNDDFDTADKDYDPFYEDWKVALEYYPKLDETSKSLSRISSRLAFNFRVYILQEKKYDEAEKWAGKMKELFLTQFFGNNPRVHEYALYLIDCGRKDVLLELNKSIKVLGSNAGRRIIEKLSSKYDLITPEKGERILWEKYGKFVSSVHAKSELAYCTATFNLWKNGEITEEELKEKILRTKRFYSISAAAAVAFIIGTLFVLIANT
jgi:curved DNA-binding protein CbpA